MFEIKTTHGIKIHCGMMNFYTPNGNYAILPKWMMEDMFIDEGAPINIREMTLPFGKLAKFQPLSKEFYKFQSPDYALQLSLSTFTTLTTGQVIPIYENNNKVLLYVMETTPSSAICINTRRGEYLDLKCDFEKSIDTVDQYVKKEKKRKIQNIETEEIEKVEKSEQNNTLRKLGSVRMTSKIIESDQKIDEEIIEKSKENVKEEIKEKKDEKINIEEKIEEKKEEIKEEKKEENVKKIDGVDYEKCSICGVEVQQKLLFLHMKHAHKK
jgi:hypothetical protein